MQDVKSVRWHPSGEVLVSTSYDDSIKLWVDAHDEWVCAQTLSGQSSLPQTHKRLLALEGMLQRVCHSMSFLIA